MTLCLVTGGAGFIGSSLARALDRARRSRSRHRQLLVRQARELRRLRRPDRARRSRHPGRPRRSAAPSRGSSWCSTRRRSRRCRSRWPSRSRTTRPTPPARCACSTPAGGPACGAWSTRRRRRPTATPRAPQGRDDAAGADLPLRRLEAGRRALRQIYARAYGVETVCLRYFNVFGPRQDPESEYAAVIPKFITAALAGQAPRIFGDGTQSRDFCYIDNIIEANFKAASPTPARSRGGVFNIACGQATDLNQVVALIGDILGRRWRRSTRTSGPGTSSTPTPTSPRRRAPPRLHRRRFVRRRARPHDRLV